MRPCATASAVFGGLLLGLSVFVACTSGLPQADPPPAAPNESAEAPLASAEAPVATATEAPEEAAPPAKNEPKTAADCKNLQTEITNDAPDGGVVMNNAMTAGDAGASDRMRPLIDLMGKNRDAFRCCFDLWGRDHPGTDGRIVLVVKLSPSGEAKEAAVDATRSDVHSPDLDACVADLAKSLPYPPSPSGKETTYSHQFNFSARR